MLIALLMLMAYSYSLSVQVQLRYPANYGKTGTSKAHTRAPLLSAMKSSAYEHLSGFLQPLCKDPGPI